MLELQDGESRRHSIIDLFGLVDTRALQSGWIDITANMDGLLGSAEFQIFHGKAMSAVPLQSPRSSRLVYPHVTEGFGFSTGLAVLNSGDEDAQVSIELRTPDGQLVATLGPLTIQAGHRLVGLIGDLFPGVELSAGTVKVLSDQPLTSLELYYSNDFRVLSAVPSQTID